MSNATVPTPAAMLAVSVEIACYCAQQQKAFLSCKVCCMYRRHSCVAWQCPQRLPA